MVRLPQIDLANLLRRPHGLCEKFAWLGWALLLIFLLGQLSGCRFFENGEKISGHSPLRPATPSPESITLEIIWARFPEGDPRLNEQVWSQIDETQIAPPVRRELANNGFRVGIVGGILPDAIADVLQLKESTSSPDGSASLETASIETASLEAAPELEMDLLVEPMVRRRLLQIRRGHRAEIQASEIYPTLPLLVNQHGELGGQTYRDAQAIYALQMDPQPGRRVQIELTPELHHGSPRLRWRSGETGILRQASLRESEIYTSLRLAANIGPGEMLLLMGLPNASSRLGHYFHTVDSPDGRQQKLILIRLAQVPSDNTFADF